MKAKGSKSGAELEKLVESWLQVNGYKTHRAAAAGLARVGKPGMQKFFVRSHDLWGVFDLVGFRPFAVSAVKPSGQALDTDTVAVQATAPAHRGARRKKIAGQGPFPASWTVLIVTHRSQRDGRRTDHWFVLEEFRYGAWSEPQDVVIDVKMLEAWRKSAHAAKKAAREAVP